MRRVIRSLIPAPVRVVLRDLWGLTPSQRPHYIRAVLGRPRPDVLPAGLGAGSRIVFVCYGNIFRSPMAEVLYAAELRRRGLGTSGVSSAGHSAREGREAHEHGVQVARTMGHSLDGHRARPLTSGIVAASDLVVVMDRLNVAVVHDRFPEARDRLVMLGAFDPDAARLGPVIPDPYGRPIGEVEACYRRIERAVNRLAARIVEQQPSKG